MRTETGWNKRKEMEIMVGDREGERGVVERH
jgi:hypothetical protein